MLAGAAGRVLVGRRDDVGQQQQNVGEPVAIDELGETGFRPLVQTLPFSRRHS
jgi:hypothetical protein